MALASHQFDCSYGIYTWLIERICANSLRARLPEATPSVKKHKVISCVFVPPGERGKLCLFPADIASPSRCRAPKRIHRPQPGDRNTQVVY